MAKHWLDKFGALARLQKFDLENQTSLVREIEMTIDSFSLNQGYVIQFFEDFRLYGLQEAINYLLNSRGVKPRTGVNEILKKIYSKVLAEVEEEKHPGAVCSKCGRTVTQTEYSSGESKCCHEGVEAEENYR